MISKTKVKIPRSVKILALMTEAKFGTPRKQTIKFFKEALEFDFIARTQRSKRTRGAAAAQERVAEEAAPAAA